MTCMTYPMADHMIQVAAESPVSPCVFVKELNNINLLLNLTHFTLAGLLAQMHKYLFACILYFYIMTHFTVSATQGIPNM